MKVSCFLEAGRSLGKRCRTIEVTDAEGAVMDGRGQKNKVLCGVFSMTLGCVTACGRVDTAEIKTLVSDK